MKQINKKSLHREKWWQSANVLLPLGRTTKSIKMAKKSRTKTSRNGGAHTGFRSIAGLARSHPQGVNSHRMTSLKSVPIRVSQKRRWAYWPRKEYMVHRNGVVWNAKNESEILPDLLG